ncbi:hypothetical protein BDP81DRAFT_463227 [Colletotrichum phormii]|uniref:Dynamin N-terminal domain-containing protein n=1 Tax=Colletotrichum phormii TaxID=359342 RepID=A0AAJ0ECD4_9PEZI|nr:uncharacterized protein BDP81DRAFT_463227 [Colletotrichum phormii]KAK1633473.1 hypothetical protein BDP81DRAFT_463227 [Colletotrichum phormii]
MNLSQAVIGVKEEQHGNIKTDASIKEEVEVKGERYEDVPLLDKLQPACETIAFSRKLQPALKTAASHWGDQISDLRDRAKRSQQTVIGVLGNTGDGKSSTINALLDEENLLPTNCMRGCTAVATEVSYNHDEDQENPYRAEIEFISQDEWSREVNILLMDLHVEDAAEKDDLDPESDAAKAQSKIEAVYPSMTPQDLASSTSAQLATHQNVSGFLGTTMTLKCNNAQEMREQLEPYVDSKDKDDDTAAYWPLVKVVRLFTKARVLVNGVTIPDHQDWDAARAAVASEYIKSCSGVWVVAPINRAVDNKTAKDIMSNSIKRQLKLDGAFSALTVICSKTDDMTISSGMDSMKSKLDKNTKTAWSQIQVLGRRITALEKELMVVRGRRKTSRASTNDVDADRPAKRAQSESPNRHAEKSAFDTSTELTKDSVIDSNPNAEKHKQLAELRQEKGELVDEAHARLIRRRNEICRDAVKRHLAKSFKDGQGQVVRECRDYDEMSASTPVFCTSSLVYQKMQGLVARHGTSEIPQLQAHAQKLTEELRVTKYQEVLNGICQVLNFIAIWAQERAGTTATIDGEQLKGMLTRFDASRDCREKLHMAAETILYEEMNRLSTVASRAAVPTAHNSNEDLLKPIKENLTETWESFFQFSLPGILDNFTVSPTNLLSTFHDDVMKQLGIQDCDHDELSTIVQLNRQLDLHRQKIVRLTAQCRMGVDDAQKDASRVLTTPVAEEMAPGYEECGMMRGFKVKIEDYIHIRKIRMFRDAIGNVKDVLEDGLKMVREDMAADIRNIGATMDGDYMLALAEKQESGRRREKASKREILEFLERAAERFKY